MRPAALACCSSHSLKRIIRHARDEEGLAVLIALIALSVFSLLGMYMTLNATTEVRISDNYESRVQASLAAAAGLNHAREAMRGMPFDIQLNGPDGAHNSTSTYVNFAQSYAYRNPLDWMLARSLNIANPSADLAGISDDGVLNTGTFGGASGLSLIPLSGIVYSQANPNGAGTATVSRYFTKASNNHLDATEPLHDPFIDSDHIIIVRSMGVARTLREVSGGVTRLNSVVVYEARFRQRNTFDLDAPFVVEGSEVDSYAEKMWDGAAFRIDGGPSNFGIATIDTDPSDAAQPATEITNRLENQNQANRIDGLGASPSIADITAAVQADEDKRLLRDPNFLWNLVYNLVPQFADIRSVGYTHWTGGSAPDLGFIDPDKPYNDPSQRPKVTWVNGDLDIGGNVSGGGLLVVTGKLEGNGSLQFNGLVLVVGGGTLDGSGLNVGIEGGLFLAKLTMTDGVASFDTPSFTWRGNSDVIMNSEAIRMGMRLLPPEQLSWREITGIIDP